MSLEVTISKKCTCGETIKKEFSDTWHCTHIYFNNPQIPVKCVCGKEWQLHLDCSIRPVKKKIPNEQYIGKVYRFEGRKIVLKEKDLPHFVANQELYTFVSDRAHGDGDFSYLCGERYCKCTN